MIISNNCFNDPELVASIEAAHRKGMCPFDESGKESFVQDIDTYIPFFSALIDCYREDSSSSLSLLDHIQKEWKLFKSAGIAKIILDHVTLIEEKPIASNTAVSLIQEITDNLQHWDFLARQLKYERRFLIDLGKLVELSWDRFFNGMYEIPIGMQLFRARLHSRANQETFREEEMSTPPKDYSSPGRANSIGIPHLYLSESLDTTLYETRATLLDDVSIGVFMPRKKLKIVDFLEPTSLYRAYSSSFQDSFILGVTSHFLRDKIDKELSRPMRRYDSYLEYVPTQFICEYIRVISGAQGIRFRSSVHQDGINYVIFNPDDMYCKAVRKAHVTRIQIDSSVEEG